VQKVTVYCVSVYAMLFSFCSGHASDKVRSEGATCDIMCVVI